MPDIIRHADSRSNLYAVEGLFPFPGFQAVLPVPSERCRIKNTTMKNTIVYNISLSQTKMKDLQVPDA